MGKFNLTPLPRSTPEPASLAFGGILREWRERRGWTFTELSARCGLARQMLIWLESNEQQASAETLGRIGRAFGVRGSRLLALAERRAAQWPACCRKCNYRCVEDGRPKWWNPFRGCSRPAR